MIPSCHPFCVLAASHWQTLNIFISSLGLYMVTVYHSPGRILPSKENFMLIHGLVTLRYRLHRKSGLYAWFFPFIYQFTKQWIVSLLSSKYGQWVVNSFIMNCWTETYLMCFNLLQLLFLLMLRLSHLWQSLQIGSCVSPTWPPSPLESSSLSGTRQSILVHFLP